MKISNFGLNPVNPYKRTQQQTEKVQHTAKRLTDQLEISSAAKSMQTIPPIDVIQQDRVASIKADIDAGTYKVNTTQLAANILQYYRK